MQTVNGTHHFNATANGVNGKTNGCAAPHISDVLHTIRLKDPPQKPVHLLNHSSVQRARLAYVPRTNAVLGNAKQLHFESLPMASTAPPMAPIRKLFPKLYGQAPLHFVNKGEKETQPKTLGVVLSGGPAPGGHNVIAGLYDFVKDHHPQGRLIGFLAGPDGLLSEQWKEVDDELLRGFRNQGGFHIFGSGRTKIKTDEQFAKARATVQNLGLDAVVIVGGDDSNSNAMKLAEDFKSAGLKCGVNGVPKTIDNDLRNDQVEVSFGFDTAAKAYSASVGALAHDAASARKSWHFVRVMGRSASHIALEVALQTHPNMTFIGEEVRRNGWTLVQVVYMIADLVAERAALGKNYGVVVLPEGLVEFMPDVEALIMDLNEILAAKGQVGYEECLEMLQERNKGLFCMLPDQFRKQLMLERDPHGNVQVAKIEAERLLVSMVGAELGRRKKEGDFKGKFSGNAHYLGYEARCALPSNFDVNYCYGLGKVAAALCCDGKTGYIATLSNLTKPAEEWIPAGYPLTVMMNMERRHGQDVAVIKKMLVELDGAAFRTFAEARDEWRLTDSYRSPGGSQFWGPCADDVTLSMALEAAHKLQ